MHEKLSDATTLTIIITTALLLFLASVVIFFLFAYQGKRYQYQKEVILLRESFNQALLQSKLEIQEQTLNHVAKELHANLSHLVSVININLSILPFNDPKTLKEKVIETKALVKQLMSEMKSLSLSLNTDYIAGVGFQKAVEVELNRLGSTKLYNITLTKTGTEYKLPPQKEIILFRLSQEVLNNIVKHANAKSIITTFNYIPEKFTLQIEDDGEGFDINSISKKDESSGIRNIVNRSKLINANVIFKSEINKGTIVTVEVPIDII